MAPSHIYALPVAGMGFWFWHAIFADEARALADYKAPTRHMEQHRGGEKTNMPDTKGFVKATGRSNQQHKFLAIWRAHHPS